MKRFFSYFEEGICVVVFILMLSLAFANVLGRYVFHSSISFTEEITTNLFVLVSVVGTAIAAKRQAHLGLGVLTEMLPLKAQKIIFGIGNLLGALFGIVLLYTGVLMVINQWKIQAKTITLMWPAWIYGLFLPIGSIFIVIRFTQVAFKHFKDAKMINDKNGEVSA